MASQSAIAEGGSIVTSDQINYENKMYSHPSYRFTPQFSNTFGQPIVLGASQTPVTINIPPEVYNMSQSYLLYSVNIPAGAAGSYIWYAVNALKEISHIQWYSGSNMWIVDCDNLQNYLDIVLKKELSQDDFLSLDPMVGIFPSNSTVNVVPALRNANATVVNTPNLQNNQSNVNYTEPAYFQVGAINSPVSYVVQFPLRLIKNTAFSIDKSVFFGQTTYLKVYFGPTSKICYLSDSNAGPSMGAKLTYTPGAGNATIGGATAPILPIQFQLMLAVETNQDLRTMTMNKVATSGISYLIPYVQAFKTSNTGQSQNISIQLDQGNGRSLVKVYHAPYSNIEDFDLMYDHSNSPYNAGSGNANPDIADAQLNQKLRTYYTQLNGRRLQDVNLDCYFTGPFLDYMQHKRQLRGSILSNVNVYQYNWFHCDDWSDFGSRYDQDNDGVLVSGIPMSVAPLTWSFVGLGFRANNNTFQHYTWFVFIKKLTMSPGVVLVQ